MLRLAAQAPRRLRPLSSNVRPHVPHQVPLRHSARSVLGAAFFLLGAAVFLWLFAGHAYGVLQAHRALDWPSVTGIVESSEVATGCGRGSANFPRVLYGYEVAATQYKAHQIAFGNIGCGTWASAMSVVRKYKIGQLVRVYWNPVQPGDSVLLAGEVLADTWYAIAVSLVALIASLFLVRYYMRKKSGLTQG